MILEKDRVLAVVLVRFGVWRLERDSLWPIGHLRPCWGTRWLHDAMLKRQTRDGLHHAPACRGNEWSGAHLVLEHCTCGAARMKPTAPTISASAAASTNNPPQEGKAS